MSIVESTLQRLKAARGAEPDKAPGAAPAPVEPVPIARVRARIPAPVRWPAQLPAADFDPARLQAAGLAAPERFTSRLRDDFRAIRREVVAASEERLAATGQTVGPIAVVTSSAPGEGKSYTALNLALSIAGQSIQDVLIIDADLVKRTISEACNLGERPGLTELLAHPTASFLDYAYPTPVPRLRVLPAGSRAHAARDLFAPARVESLFEAIRAAMAEHIVIVDTPPILISSDTAALTDVAGQVLLVVRAGKSLHDAVRDAVGHIRKTLPVGVILNDWSPLLPSEKKTYTSYDQYAR